MARGKVEYDKFKAGKSLTRKQAMNAQCYVCNGEGEGGEDCMAKDCPLYEYMPYNSKIVKKPVSEERRRQMSESLEKARATRLERS